MIPPRTREDETLVVPETAAPADTDDRPTILIVDDDPMVRVVASSYLTTAGFEVREAADLAAARRQLERGQIDLVLLDVNLPGESGLDLCIWVRQQPILQHLPVIVLTGLEHEEIIHAAFDAGATDFLRKPVEGAILIHRVRFTLRASRTVRSLAASEASLGEAQRIAQLGSFELDLETEELRHSPQFAVLFGLAPDHLMTTSVAVEERIHPEDREQVGLAHLDIAADASARRMDLTFRIVDAEGAVRWVHERSVVARDDNGRPIRRTGTLQDVTERRSHEDRIAYLATHDRVTGLLNREGFERVVKESIDLPTNRGECRAVVQVSLENFAQVQARLGPDRAARLLRQAADRLAGRSRTDDITSRGAEAIALGQWEGDAFALFYDKLDGADDALDHARAAVSLLALPFDLGQHRVGVTPRAGVAIHPTDGTTVEELVRSAGTARQSLQIGGREPVRRHDPRLTMEADLRVQLEHDLRAALGRDELELAFQPQVDARGVIVSAEALVRWHHRVHGWISPERFVPLAEEAGLIDRLGRWVIDRAVAELGGWKRAGLDLRVAINLSAAQLDDPELMPTIERALERHHLSGGDLEFEVTENLLIGGGDAVGLTLVAIKATGAHLALDDFGTGYSSLSYLSFLPLDVLKIDRSFVQAMERPGPLAVVRAIIALAQGLGLGVVAEGVETRRQADVLLAEGCDTLQGYLFGRPMPADALRALVTEAQPLR